MPQLLEPEKKTPSLALAIRKIRELRGMTQEEVSHAAGKNKLFINHIENGHRGTAPRQDTIESIAEALNVPPSFIYILADDTDDALVKKTQKAVIKLLEQN